MTAMDYYEYDTFAQDSENATVNPGFSRRIIQAKTCGSEAYFLEEQHHRFALHDRENLSCAASISEITYEKNL